MSITTIIEVIAFDVFGTVFDTSTVDHLELTPMLIRGASCIKNIIDLASALGCSDDL